jgi:TPR repeat protein
MLFLTLAAPARAERWEFKAETNTAVIGDRAMVFFSLGRRIWLIQFSVHKSAQFIDPKIAFVQNDESYTVFNIDAGTLGNKYLPNLDHSISQFPLTDEMFELMMSSNRIVYNIADQNYHAVLDGSRAALTQAVDQLPYFLAAEDDKQHAIAQAKSDAKQAKQRAIDATADCDRLAGNKWDPNVIGNGVLWGDMDGSGAVNACYDALNQSELNPDDKARITYQLGRAYDKMGDKRSLEYIREAALKNGYGAAIYHLSLFYEDGLYTPKNPDQAKVTLRVAHNMGIAPATYSIGKDAFQRASTPGQSLDAEIILKKSVDVGYPTAMNYYGSLILDGKTNSGNIELAIQYLDDASMAGNSNASYRLATLYREGVQVGENARKYKTYLRLAADQGHKTAISELGE